jgi:hypothetical protein
VALATPPARPDTEEIGANCLAAVLGRWQRGFMSEAGCDPDDLVITRLADVPVPPAGYADVEAHFLAWGLVGTRRGNIDEHLAHWEASAGAPDGPGIRHLIIKRGDLVLGEGWLEHREDGTGRNYREVDDDKRRLAHDVTIDAGQRPGSERLRQILATLPTSQANFPPILNALAVADGEGPASPDLVLLERKIRRLNPSDTRFMRSAFRMSKDIFALQERLRHQCAISAPDAAALMLASQIPSICAQMHPDDPAMARATFSRYLTFVANSTRFAPEVAARLLVAMAVRDGYTEALKAVAAEYYSSAMARREYALDAPDDPMDFARRLYNAAPTTFCVVLICRGLRAAIGDGLPAADEWAKRETSATEFFIRLGDGIFHQYMDFCLGQIRRERDKIVQARADGDDRLAWRLLRDGEFMLRWPRSYRPYLTGEASLPVLRYPTAGA